MDQQRRKDLRDAMAIVKMACWDVEELSEGRRILGHVMVHIYNREGKERLDTKAQEAVKSVYPDAHCAPLAQAYYPDFYVIRAKREEWAESLAMGETPDVAWKNAHNKI